MGEINLRRLQQLHIDAVDQPGQGRQLHGAVAGVQDTLGRHVGRGAHHIRLRAERELKGVQGPRARERAADFQSADDQPIGADLHAGMRTTAIDRTAGIGHQVHFARKAAAEMLAEQHIEIGKVGERPLELTLRTIQILRQGQLTLRVQALPVGLRQGNVHVLPGTPLHSCLQRDGLGREYALQLHLGLGRMRQVCERKGRGQRPRRRIAHCQRRLGVAGHTQRRKVATQIGANARLA